MMWKALIISLFVLLEASFSAAESGGPAKDKLRLTIWIIPFEPPTEPIHLEENIPLKDQLSWFNRKQAASNLTVLNTTVDWMVDQLVVWNSEFNLPNWSLICGQEKTLKALGQFAKENNVDLRVRFLTWKTIISGLENELSSRPKSALGEINRVPDVVQIGSTWVPYFAEKKILLPAENPSGKLSWRKIDDVPVSLPFTIDVRLMFYWKKLPGSSKPFRDILKNPSGWQGIVDALSELVLDEDNPAPPMVMPVGLTFNLFHDFVPLVWASGVPFFVETIFGTRTNMSDQVSLRVPYLISQNATTIGENGLSYRIVSFPEMNHETAARHFMEGIDYVAIIQPAAFIARWRQNFMQYVSVSPEAFWDCAGMTLLPATFKGGTDLMVVNGTGEKRMAFRLARFLANDDEHSAVAAENGYLPAQNSDFGLGVLLDMLGGSSCKGAKNAIGLIRTAMKEGREYACTPEWPTRMESIEVLEAMQTLWRRIGEGDTELVREYAGKAEMMINSRIYWPVSLWLLVKKLWPAISLILALAFLGLYLHSRKITWRNRLLRIAVDSLRRRDYVLVSRAGAFVSDCQQVSERECGEFSEYLHDLRTRTLRLEENIRKDLEHFGNRRFPVSNLIHEAWENAASQHRISYPSGADDPKRPVIKDDLDHLKICRMPYVFVGILQDWFYNCMKNDLYMSDHIEIRLWHGKRKNHGLAIYSLCSGTSVHDQPLGPLPEKVFDLMCELSKAAYGRTPIIKEIEMPGENNTAQKCTVIYVRAPLIG